MSTRTLKLTSPAMRGPDVERFQADINAELKRWKIDPALAEDGVYGTETRDVARSVCFGLGMTSPVMENGATPTIRSKVRHRKLTAAELKRYRDREDWRKRLARRLGAPDHGVELALAYARAHIGVTEHPAGSNSGPLIDDWERACGVSHAPWCGCFANACLTAAGFPDQPWLRYCPWIEQKAKAGEGGWRWSSTAVVGALVLYGAQIAVHVGFVAEVEHGIDTQTIEGNTGTGPGGSQSNGGIVAVRHRHTDGSLAGFPIRGYAIPPYSKLA